MGELLRLRAPEREEQDQQPISLVRPQPEMDRKGIEELSEIWADNGGLPDDQIVADIQMLRDMMARNELPESEHKKLAERAGVLHDAAAITDITYKRILDILCTGR